MGRLLWLGYQWFVMEDKRGGITRAWRSFEAVLVCAALMRTETSLTPDGRPWDLRKEVRVDLALSFCAAATESSRS